MRLVRPERFELPTTAFEAQCSIQLSYGRVSAAVCQCRDLVANLQGFYFGTKHTGTAVPQVAGVATYRVKRCANNQLLDEESTSFIYIILLLSTKIHSRDISNAIQRFRQHGGTLRTRQALDLGIHPAALYNLRDSGCLIELARDLYRLAEAPEAREQKEASIKELASCARVLRVERVMQPYLQSIV